MPPAPGAVFALKARLAADNGWGYYARDPLAQEIHHRFADRFLTHGCDAAPAAGSVSRCV